jgi:hypothetical protein
MFFNPEDIFSTGLQAFPRASALVGSRNLLTNGIVR